MHEISAAHGLIQALIEEAERHGLIRVTSARVAVNPVDGLSPENLAYWVQVLAQGTCVQGVTVEVQTVADSGENCPVPGTVMLEQVHGIAAGDRE